MTQEERELREDHDPAPEQGPAGRLPGPAAQVPLHDELIGPVGGDGEARPPDEARPEGVAPGRVEREVEQAEPVRRGAGRGHLRPSARDEVEEDDRGDDRAAQVHRELHHVRPQHRGQPAAPSVGGGDRAHRHDRQDEQGGGRREPRGQRGGGGAGGRPRQEGRPEDDPRGHEPEAVGEVPGREEDGGGETAHAGVEALGEDLVDGEVLAPEVARQQEHGDDRPAREVAEDELQKGQIGPEGEPRDADEGRGARLRRDDRGHHHAPRRPAAGREVVADGRLPTREDQAQREGRRHVDDDDQEVEQAHGDRCGGSSVRRRAPPGAPVSSTARRGREPGGGAAHPRADRGNASSPMARRTRFPARRMRARALA